MLTHGNLASNIATLHACWQWTAGDVLLHALPLFHIHGLFVAAHGALWNGSKMIFLPKFDSADVIRQLPRSTVFMGVPTYYVRLLSDPAFTRDCSSNIRLFVSGSAPLPAAVHSSICWSPSELPKARTGRRPMRTRPPGPPASRPRPCPTSTSSTAPPCV